MRAGPVSFLSPGSPLGPVEFFVRGGLYVHLMCACGSESHTSLLGADLLPLCVAAQHFYCRD